MINRQSLEEDICDGLFLQIHTFPLLSKYIPFQNPFFDFAFMKMKREQNYNVRQNLSHRTRKKMYLNLQKYLQVFLRLVYFEHGNCY